MDKNPHKTDTNHNINSKRKPGRPRLPDTELRRYWRESKKRQKERRKNFE